MASMLCAVLVEPELQERDGRCYLGAATLRSGVDGSYRIGSWRRCFGTLPPGLPPIWYCGDAAHGNPGCGGV